MEDQVAEVIGTLNNVVRKSELSDLILDLSSPQLKYGFFTFEWTADRSKSRIQGHLQHSEKEHLYRR